MPLSDRSDHTTVHAQSVLPSRRPLASRFISLGRSSRPGQCPPYFEEYHSPRCLVIRHKEDPHQFHLEFQPRTLPRTVTRHTTRILSSHATPKLETLFNPNIGACLDSLVICEDVTLAEFDAVTFNSLQFLDSDSPESLSRPLVSRSFLERHPSLKLITYQGRSLRLSAIAAFPLMYEFNARLKSMGLEDAMGFSDINLRRVTLHATDMDAKLSSHLRGCTWFFEDISLHLYANGPSVMQIFFQGCSSVQSLEIEVMPECEEVCSMVSSIIHFSLSLTMLTFCSLNIAPSPQGDFMTKLLDCRDRCRKLTKISLVGFTLWDICDDDAFGTSETVPTSKDSTGMLMSSSARITATSIRHARCWSNDWTTYM